MTVGGTGARAGATPAEVIAEELERWLGANTARTALRVFTHRATGLAAEQLRPADVPKVLEALRRMLNTLLGARRADEVLATIARRFVP